MNLRHSMYFILRFFSRLFFGRNFLIRHKKINNLYCFIKLIFDLFSYAHWKQKNWEWNNPEAPWLVQDSIAYLDDWLNNDMKGFEFGSGRSTKWFTERVSFYFSTEGDYKWYKKSIEINKENIKKKKCEIVFKDVGNLMQIDVNKMQSYSGSLSKFKDQYFDFGLVDGHFRMECIYNSLKKIKKNGILIIDNSDAIDGVDIFYKKYKYKKFSNGIWETTILFF